MAEADNSEGRRAGARKPKGRPYRRVPPPDAGRSVSMLGIGMIVGAVIGAGITLLVAPQSGADTRRTLSRTAGRFSMGAGVWNKLGRELQKAARAKRKTLELEAKRDEVETRRAVRGEAAPV